MMLPVPAVLQQHDLSVPTVSGRLPILIHYWRVILRWKWIILGIMLFALAAAFVVTMFMRPLYTATATIEIARERENIVNVKGVEPSVNGGDLEFYQTQYSLLRARSLAERVATDLRLANNPAFFEAFGVDPDGEIFSDDRGGGLSAKEREERRKLAVRLLLDNIAIAPTRGSALVNVSFTSSSPFLSQQVANAWTKAFMTSNLDRRFEATSYARKFLEERLEQLRRRLEDSERQLVQYAAAQRIISIPTGQASGEGPPAERSLIADDLARLNAELANATADRIRAQSHLGNAGQVSKESLESDTIAALRQRRAELASDLSNLLTKFAPEYPAVVALSSQLKAIDSSIAQEERRVSSGLDQEYADAVTRERSLKAKVEQLKNGALDLRGRSIQYNIIQREADTNRQLYDGLLQRYKEIGVAGGVGTNNVLIVDSADVPVSPTSPNLFLNLLLGLLSGAAVAAAFVVAREQIDESIKDPTDARRTLTVPLLGAVPIQAGARPTDALQDRKSAMADAYLSIQTSLRFSTDHGVPRSLGVTSTRPAEGKSTTSYALANSLARTGKNVILIDGDMRSPSAHEMLMISNEAGLSNYLAGDDNLERLLLRAELLGIDVLPAGPQPPNAAELLTSNRLQLLIARLLETYDHVVIDCPPVLGMADAPLIASQVEGVVYAIEANGPKAGAVNAGMARLKGANANILGAVLTKFKEQSAHYGYGYEYGYGYGKNVAEA
jgi:succinoglycan biosynthesis transport protein ExoP